MKLNVLIAATIVLLGFGWDDIQIAYIGPGHERPFGIKHVYINGVRVLHNDILDSDAIKHSGKAIRV